MEIEKSSSSKKKKINKSKLLYKFQICDSVPNKKLFDLVILPEFTLMSH